jgi:hypothetical protein
LLDARDLIYVFSLLIPLAIFEPTLKAIGIYAETPATEFSLWKPIDLLRSEALFVVGYRLVWIGLFAKPGPSKISSQQVRRFHHPPGANNNTDAWGAS